MRPTLRLASTLAVFASIVFSPEGAFADGPEGSWVDLSKLSAWKGATQGWSTVGDAKLDIKDPKRLAAKAGSGVICNGPTGKIPNIVTVEDFGDVEVHLEFFLPKGSNSGIKFQGVYEIQLCDSHGVKEPKGSDSGGVYPRSEEKPKYHHIDGGHPPMVNAALPAGQWQTLDAVFVAPKFNPEGIKIANAQITATLNGRKIHENLNVETPTGSAHHDQEKTTGPLLLQADHGPVAFRNIRARRLDITAAR